LCEKTSLFDRKTLSGAHRLFRGRVLFQQVQSTGGSRLASGGPPKQADSPKPTLPTSVNTSAITALRVKKKFCRLRPKTAALYPAQGFM